MKPTHKELYEKMREATRFVGPTTPAVFPPIDYVVGGGIDGTYGDCVEVVAPLPKACPLCGRRGPHRSGPDDKYHHVVLNVDGTWPE